MNPFRFGPPHRQLYGIHHPAAAGASRKAAVLVCNPFGQEAVRTHRMFRVLAERLAQKGVHVLRFDYHGTGESSGDDLDGHVDAWRDDVLLAHQELRRRSMDAPITWFGTRLGATLAALAAMHAPDLPTRLLLWEPVVDGTVYLEDLARNHQRALQASFGVVPAPHRERPRHEALGFEMSDTLLGQLRALGRSSLAGQKVRPVTVIAPAGHADADALAAQARDDGTEVRQIAFSHHFDWSSEEAINTALVPHDAVTLLAQHLIPSA